MKKKNLVTSFFFVNFVGSFLLLKTSETHGEAGC